MKTINIAVVGYGYWGPNIVRNFNAVEGGKVVAICDIDQNVLNRVKKQYPHIETFKDYRKVTSSSNIDAVAIVVPVSKHYEVAKAALLGGKHIFVEKPFTHTVAHAEELIALAEKKKLKIMVDHTFLFTGAVRKIKELVDKDELGKLYYFDSTRINLGLFQSDINVVWDLAPHDLSIMDYLIPEQPKAVAVTGMAHFNDGIEDVAYLTVYFHSKLIAHFNVNWLSPVKIRMTLLSGEKKMLVWDDLARDEKIKIYDCGVQTKSKEGMYKLLMDYRSGDIWSPRVDPAEALKVELQYFVDCILKDHKPFNDGHAGLRVVRILEAADKSIRKKGEIVEL